MRKDFQLTVSKSSAIIISGLPHKTVQVNAVDFSESVKTITPTKRRGARRNHVTRVPLCQKLSEAIAVATARLNKRIPSHMYREFAKSNGK